MASTLISNESVRKAALYVSNDPDGVDDDTLELYIDSSDAFIVKLRGAHPTGSTTLVEQELARRRACLISLVNLALSSSRIQSPQELVNEMLPASSAWLNNG